MYINNQTFFFWNAHEGIFKVRSLNESRLNLLTFGQWRAYLAGLSGQQEPICLKLGMGRIKTQPEIWPAPSNFLEDPSQSVVILS